MVKDGVFLVQAIAMAVLVGLVAATLILRRRSADRKKAAAPQVEVEDYYDEEGMGVVEVASGRKHGFPNDLIQQMDVKPEEDASPSRIAVYVTAEFHHAEFRFTAQQLDAFLATMEKALPDFQAAGARQGLQHALSTGARSTIYVSPDYARDMAGSPGEAQAPGP